MRAVAEVTTTASARNVDLLDNVDYRLAETPEEREEIYRLRYRAYLREGAIRPSDDQRVTDRFDSMPNSWIFGVYLDGVLASSVRISVASPESPSSPSMDVFPDLLEPELKAGKVMVDPTRFVADPARERRFPELPYVTLRLAYIACGFFNADLGLASVRAEHQAFYRRVFMHQPIASSREYPGLVKPICLMAVDYPAMRDKVFERYPFLRSSYFERRMLFERSSECSAAPNLSGVACGRASMVPGGLIRTAPTGPSDDVRGRIGLKPAGQVPSRTAIRAASSGIVLRTSTRPIARRGRRSPSPWRHIYKSLTIAMAFRQLAAFDAVAQHLIKVDGTFA